MERGTRTVIAAVRGNIPGRGEEDDPLLATRV
jgi:hypothetical protein